ncbi:MAG: oligosaccharide flippase family protein, partial [Nitrospiraceae bacterium]|nr:oligosaccharide flippase family protein [Nitrospiraceae bacterium]
LGAEQVGYYAAAVRLSEAWYFVPMAITSSVFPAIINAKKQSEAFYYQRLQKLYDLMAWLAVAIALPTTFLAPWVIRVLYGKAFLRAAGFLSIHIWAGVFVFFATAWSKHMLAENKQSIFIRYDISSVCINVILNFLLIPIIGIKGAAIATAFSVPATYLLFMMFYPDQRVTILYLLKAISLYRLWR